jgi:hypothetical protein
MKPSTCNHKRKINIIKSKIKIKVKYGERRRREGRIHYFHNGDYSMKPYPPCTKPKPIVTKQQ